MSLFRAKGLVLVLAVVACSGPSSTDTEPVDDQPTCEAQIEAAEALLDRAIERGTAHWMLPGEFTALPQAEHAYPLVPKAGGLYVKAEELWYQAEWLVTPEDVRGVLGMPGRGLERLDLLLEPDLPVDRLAEVLSWIRPLGIVSLRLVVGLPDDTDNFLPDSSAPAWVREHIRAVAAADPRDRDMTYRVARTWSRAIDGCDAAQNVISASSLQPSPSRLPFYRAHLGKALRMCSCRGIDVAGYVYNMLAADGVYDGHQGFFPLHPANGATAAITVRGDATIREVVKRLETLAVDIASPERFPAIEIEAVGDELLLEGAP